MAGPGFIHLHVHSGYSLLEGALPFEKLIDLAKADKQPALGIADTNNLFGALEFSEKASGKGIQPLIGTELAIDFGGEEGRPNERGPSAKNSIVLIAATETGFGNLSRLVSKSFLEGENGKVTAIRCVRADDKIKPIPGTEFTVKADLVLLAMGFVHPVKDGMLASLGVALDPRGNAKANTEDYKTSIAKMFAAGDMRRGQSLVVWAIREGRQCAHAIDKFLMGTTTLPR